MTKSTTRWRIMCLIILCLYLAGRAIGHAVNENLAFRILFPRELAFDYTIRPAKNFGGVFNFYYSKIPLVLADPREACGELHNADEIRGAVALVIRGECSFLSKSIIADHAGALMVIIYDKDETNDSRFIDMIDDETKRNTTIPAAFMLGRDGKVIEHHLNEHNDVVEIAIPVNTTGIPYSHLHRPPWTLW
ncbi:protease-associated domain-containing protein 1-like [Diadema antillarum]|uniref:protease-associated domain-containing protein 1-like n=1 Tax=Diadema antillarum TaxID=105358 RepID=UPI003A886BE6